MKNILIASTAIILGGLIAYNFTGNSLNLKTTQSILKKENSTSSKLVNTSKKEQSPIEFLETYGIEKLRSALDSNKINRDQFKEALVNSLENYNSCIKDKSCTNIEKENSFHDKRTDPIFQKVKHVLDGIEYMAHTEPEILDRVKAQKLYDLMSFENPASFHLANTLVFNKGRKAILGSGKMAKSLSSKLLGSYLKLISDKSLLADREIRKLRNGLIDSYISSSEPSKMLITLNTINTLNFNNDEVRAIKTSYCRMQTSTNSEASRVLNAKFTRFIIKYKIDSNC